jgi:hypothetical protein
MKMTGNWVPHPQRQTPYNATICRKSKAIVNFYPSGRNLHIHK